MGIPHYLIKQKLNVSPTAAVVIAKQKLLNREAAIKIINGNLFKSAQQRSTFLAALQRTGGVRSAATGSY